MNLQIKKVTTVKKHKCFGCYGVIPIGRKVEKFAGTYEGDFNHGYICEICEIAREEIDDVFYQGDLIENREFWESAAHKFEERTGTAYNKCIEFNS
jgi:hypothetical protein